MKGIIFLLFILAILSLSIPAQNDDSQIILYAEQENMTLHSILISTAGLAQEVLQNQDLKILVNIHGNKGEYFATPYIYNAVIFSQLKNQYKLSDEKFLVQNCNVLQESFRIQVFQLPQSVTFESCGENLIIPTESLRFETLYYHPENDALDDEALEDGPVDLYDMQSQYSRTSLGVLLNFLTRSPESRVYLVAYLGTNLHGFPAENDSGETVIEDVRDLDKKYKAKKILNDVKKILDNNGIRPSTIKTIKGGYREGQKHVEIWFVPKGGEIPKPKPDYFQ